MRDLLFLLVMLVMLPGCLDSKRTHTINDVIRPEDENKDRVDAAEANMVSIENDLQNYASLSPAKRRAAEMAMGPRLEQAITIAAETRIENKAIYYLANWRYTYQNGDGVDALLNKLFSLESPALKSSGERLLVLLRLRQGRTSEARGMAEKLIERIPEFSPLLDVVKFHEMIGSDAPKLVSKNLTGGPDDPITERKEPWLCYLFIDIIDENSIYLIQRYFEALSVLPENDQRIVCVTFEANLLGATAKVRSLPNADKIDLLWANPNKGGATKEWIEAWKLPIQNPHIALLGPGPNRTIMAVEVTPESLKELLSATLVKPQQ